MRYKSVFQAICILLCICFGVITSCSGHKAKQDKAGSLKVQTEMVSRGVATVYTDFATQIESENIVVIYSRATGYIQQVYVKEGDNVKKGAVILRINDAEYRQTVNSTRAAYENAQLEVRKLQPLVEKGIISPYQLQTANSNLQAARAAYENARINLSYTLVKSPVSGVIGRITLRAGSLLTAGLAEPITTVASNGDVFAYFAFDEKKLLQLCDSTKGTLKQKIAQLPQVELILADGRSYGEKGRLQLGSSIVDQTTGALQMKAVFPNPQALLHTGTSGTLRVPAHYNNVLLIPQKATYEIQDKKMVFVVDKQNIVHATNISVADNTSDQYIVTDGISEGDIIVLEGLNRLKDGDHIVPLSSKDKGISTK